MNYISAESFDREWKNVSERSTEEERKEFAQMRESYFRAAQLLSDNIRQIGLSSGLQMTCDMRIVVHIFCQEDFQDGRVNEQTQQKIAQKYDPELIKEMFTRLGPQGDVTVTMVTGYDAKNNCSHVFIGPGDNSLQGLSVTLNKPPQSS